MKPSKPKPAPISGQWTQGWMFGVRLGTAFSVSMFMHAHDWQSSVWTTLFYVFAEVSYQWF